MLSPRSLRIPTPRALFAGRDPSTTYGFASLNRAPLSDDMTSFSAAEKSLFLSAACQQIRSDERLQITVEHTIDVADFSLRPVILDHAVRLEHVRADLRSEFDVELGVFNLLRGRPLLFHFEFVEFRAQHAHGTVTVLVLRALVLATGDQSRGDVSDAHRGIGGVDVLSAFSARPICIGTNVFRLDYDFDAVVDFG